MKNNRREFCKTAAAGALGAVVAPRVVTAAKTETDKPIIGAEGHQYRVDHNWAQLPDKYRWQTSHSVAVDSQGLMYVIHQGSRKKSDHPTIFVFEQNGAFVRAFAPQFNGGGHGIEVRNEGGEDFLYVCAYHHQRSYAKLTTTGEELWRRGAPIESGLYAEGEENFPRDPSDNPWGRKHFHPTNIAFHPDGGFYLADGYGSWRVHQFDADGKWVRSFGNPSGKGDRTDGKFNLPHGVWIDARGEEPLVVVADRVHERLQWFSLDGEHRSSLDGFILPANVDAYGDLLLVPDLAGRVTLLGKQNEVISHLGNDSERVLAEMKNNLRGKPDQWIDGKFVHPHDACFDLDGNIYVTEWVGGGRVTKLTKLG